ncbi:MAG: cytochrome C oxidase subunit II [Myxococcota bacterium]
MIEHYLEQASTFAADIDNLILLITVTVGFWFLLAQFLFFGFILKFRAQEGKKAQYISGENKKEKRWVSLPHYATLFFDVLIIIAAIRVWQDVKMTMPQADSTVRIVVQQWAWTFVHPGPDNKLDTADDIRTVDELHVEKDKTYHFELQSRDVLHSFSVPAFRLKQDAIPGRTIKGWFKPTLTGGFDIQCTEICGIGHGIMAARVLIENAADHAAWVKANAPQVAAVTPTAPADNVPTGGSR